ncbi:urea carboxylase-associated family protein [Paenibacillus sp. YYML68]|uniref:urea carboxylase-associated family protein n=1 Tax=Paenibacillus sp. YYML68 TaxID=2909250 RepID=UPI002492A782|nr:urea carboxylase-associated family protein [Paenibacillus sp. YYML68]
MKQTFTIPAKHGFSARVYKGNLLRLIDVEGEQIGDFVAYNVQDTEERLDPIATRDALETTQIRKGQVIYSNKYVPMLTLVEDTVEKHDLLSPACRPEMYKLLYEKDIPYENCYMNLSAALAKFGIEKPGQHYPFNIFMNTVLHEDGSVEFKRPKSKAGDYVVLRAEMDLFIAISACPNEQSMGNGCHSTDLCLEIDAEQSITSYVVSGKEADELEPRLVRGG